MLLSIIVINYKTFDITSGCLKSLIALFGNEIGKNIELIAVDNGSGAEEVKKLQKLRDQIGFKLLTSETNFGFASGCNIGAEISEGSLLLFVNSDTKDHKGILEMPDLFEKDPKIGVVGGKMLRPNGEAENSAGRFYNLFNLFLVLFFGERIGYSRFAPKKLRRVDWVSGGFMMIRKSLFDKVSGFDEDYFMYLEDMDICQRLRKAGFYAYSYPQASLVHLSHGSGSREFAIVGIYKSLKIYYRKNKSLLAYNIAIALLKLKARVAYFVGKFSGNKELIKTYSQALWAIS